MGKCGSKESTKQILLCGLDQVGKTTFLYTEYGMLKDEFTTEPTLGYNFETIDIKGRKVNVFDIGGQESVRHLWPIFYKKLQFDAIIFMINAYDEKRFYEAKSEFHRLANEEELRNVAFCVLYNYKDRVAHGQLKDARETNRLTEKERDSQRYSKALNEENKSKGRNTAVKQEIGNIIDEIDGQSNEKASFKNISHDLMSESSPRKSKNVLKSSDSPNKAQDFIQPSNDPIKLEARRKVLDIKLGLDELHTFQKKASFMFNILDPELNKQKGQVGKDDIKNKEYKETEDNKSKMYNWLLQRLSEVSD